MVNEDPLLGGQWRSLAWWPMKIPCLVANEGSHAWWSMKIPCLVANEGSHAWWSMGGKEEGSLLPIPTSPWATLFEPSFYFIFYPLTLNFYFTMVLGHHLYLFFLSSAYNHDRKTWCHKSTPLPLSIRFCWRSFFFSLKVWRCARSHPTGPKPHKRMQNRLRNHL